jgi:nitroreductase
MLRSIEDRRSIRKYKSTPVSEKQMTAILESARQAPSGSNTQPWHFIVVKDDASRREIASVSHNQRWMLTAPIFIACVADMRSRVPGGEIAIDEESPAFELKQIIRDTAIAIEHLILEATNQGLGTCWVAWFTQAEIRRVLGLPGDKFVVAVITVGYAEENPSPRKRKKMAEIVHYEKW